MTIGLSLPVGVGKNGRARLDKDNVAHNKKIVFLALGVNDDENYFQDIGLDRSLVFNILDNSFRVKAERKINQIFQKLSYIVQLNDTQPITFDASVPGEVKMNLEYIDITVNKPEDLERTYKR